MQHACRRDSWKPYLANAPVLVAIIATGVRMPRLCGVRSGQDLHRIQKLMHLAVTSAMAPIYSGDKQRENDRSELAIPAARSTGSLRYRWSITATS